jgi:hypothetical protein
MLENVVFRICVEVKVSVIGKGTPGSSLSMEIPGEFAVRVLETEGSWKSEVERITIGCK